MREAFWELKMAPVCKVRVMEKVDSLRKVLRAR